MEKKQTNIWGIFVAVIAGLIVWQVLMGGYGSASEMVGKAAPAFEPGTWVTSSPPSSSHLAGNGYVLEFWATWCGPCEQTIPHLIELTREYPDVVFIGLSTDDSAEPVRQMVREKGINYHVAMAGSMASRYGVRGIPAAFVIDSEQTIVWQGHPLDPGLEKAIKELARQPQNEASVK